MFLAVEKSISLIISSKDAFCIIKTISSEEVFVNGKKIDAFEKHHSIGDEILSKVKEGIKDSFDSIQKDSNKIRFIP